MGITRYKNIAAAQNPGGQRTGKAGGGRVKKQVGGRGPVRGPNVQLTAAQQRGVARQGRPIAPPSAQTERPFDPKRYRQETGEWRPLRPGGKTGGRVKKQRGGEPQFRTDPSGRRGQAAYYGHVAPKAARKQLRKKPPGRAATQGIGMKKGGRVSKAKGGKSKR